MERNLTLAIKIIEKKNGHCRNINYFFVKTFYSQKIGLCVCRKFQKEFANQRTHCALCLSLEGGPFTFSGDRGWVDLVIQFASWSQKIFPRPCSGFLMPPFWSKYESIDSMQCLFCLLNPIMLKFLRYIKVYVSIFRKEYKANVKNIFLFRSHSSLQNLLSLTNNV